MTTPDGVTQTREIRGGLGHAGHNGPYIAHFGLGKHAKARVWVTWSGPVPGVWVDLKADANQRLVAKQ